MRISFVGGTVLFLLVATGAFMFASCGTYEGGCLFAEDGCGPVADSGDEVDAEAEAEPPVDSALFDVQLDSADVKDSDVGVDVAVDSSDAAPDVAPDVDAGNPGCGSTGTVVFDSAKMSCYKVVLVRGGAIVPAPESSDNTPSCELGGCANTPITGDFDVLWAAETGNTGYFTSLKVPVAYNGHCLPAYTAASPPDLNQLKATLTLPTGWFTPGVTKVATSYTLTAPSCAGQSVVYVMQYGP